MANADGSIEILLLRPDEVLCDPEVQRTFDKLHAAKIGKEYEPALFGLGHASCRPDGYYVMDGQHRCGAAHFAKLAHVPVPFQVYRGLSHAQEAELFAKLNAHKKKVGALDAFRVSVKAGNPVAIDITRVLNSFGLAVGSYRSAGTISAIAALVQIYNGKIVTKMASTQKPVHIGGLPQSQLLSRTLTVLTKAWGKDRDAFEGILLRGVAGVLQKHGGAVDGDRLAKLLSKSSDPARALGQIRSLQGISKKTPVTAAIEYIEGVYNRRVSEDKRLK